MYATLLLVFLAAASGFPSHIPQECMEEVQRKYATHLTLSRHDVRDHKEIMKRVIEQIDISKCENVHFKVVFDDDKTELKNDNVSNKPPRKPEPANEPENIRVVNSEILERYADRLREEDDVYILNVNSREESKTKNKQRKSTQNKQNSEDNQKETYTTKKEQQNNFTTERINRFEVEEGEYENIDEEDYDNEKYSNEKYDDVETFQDDTVKQTYGRRKTNYQNGRQPYGNKRRSTNRYPSTQANNKMQSDYTYSDPNVRYNNEKQRKNKRDETNINYNTRQRKNKKEETNDNNYKTRQPYDTQGVSTVKYNKPSLRNTAKNKTNNDYQNVKQTNVRESTDKFVNRDESGEYDYEYDYDSNEKYYGSNKDTKTTLKTTTTEAHVSEGKEKNKFSNRQNYAETSKIHDDKYSVEDDDDDNPKGDKKPKYEATKGHVMETETTTKAIDNEETKKIINFVTDNTEQVKNVERNKYFNSSIAKESNSDKTQTQRQNPQNMKNNDKWEIVHTTENVEPVENNTPIYKTTDIIFGGTKEVFENNHESDTISNKQNVNREKTKTSISTDEVNKKEETPVKKEGYKDASKINFVTDNSKVTTKNEFTTLSETKQDKITDKVQTKATIDHTEKKDTILDTDYTSILTLHGSQKESTDSTPKLQNNDKKVDGSEKESIDSESKLQNNDQEGDGSEKESTDSESNYQKNDQPANKEENDVDKIPDSQNTIQNDHGDHNKNSSGVFVIVNVFKTISELIFSIIQGILSILKADGQENA